MNYSDLVSVIVPVYNVEKYLIKCVDSIINQTYRNLEIILVDDGSTDNSRRICDEYKQKDNRIVVIHKENGGLSDARNTGLNICTGEYITFIDSDDYISDLYIENLYKIIKKYNADISVCAEEYVKYDKNNEYVKLKRPFREFKGELLMNSDNALECALRQDLFDFSACAKLYKKECLNDVKFPLNYMYEDQGTVYKTFFKSKRIVFTSDKLYFYIQRQGSILHNNSSSKRYWDGIKMVEMQHRDIIKKNPRLKKAANCRCLSMYFHVLIGAHNTNDKELTKYSWKKIKELRLGVLIDSKGRKKTKAAAIISMLGKILFIKINNIIDK